MSRANRMPVVRLPFTEPASQSPQNSHRILGTVLLGFLIFASSSVHPAQAQSGPSGSGWVLTFDDEFQGTSLDLSKWAYEPAYQWRAVGSESKSDPSAVIEGNGVLQLTTYLTDPNGPITLSNTSSGQIWTQPTFSQQYGWFEFRCKMAPGAGMDEALWLLGGPEYQEIDMPEWLGNRPNTLYLAHWFVPPGGAWSGSMSSPTGPDWSADFHTYAINWQPDSITYYVDGIQYYQVTDGIPQTPMSILITSGASVGWGGDINASTCPNSMVLQYVRVYQGGGTTPPVPPPPPSPLPPPSGINLIQDPNYTQQTEGDGTPLIAPWSSTGPATNGLNTTDGNGPNPTPCAFLYDGGTGAWSAITQTVAVSPNTNYTISCSIQTDSPFSAYLPAVFAAQGLMGAQTTGGAILASQSYGQMTNYTQLTVTFNSGSNSSVLVFAGFKDQGSGAWIHVDNWSLTTKGGPPPPPPTGANLIQDPNYTQQTEGDGTPLSAPWSSIGPATNGLNTTDGNGPNPTPCAFLYDGGTGAWSAILQTVAVSPNTNYTLSCSIQTSSPFPGGGIGAWVPGGGPVIAQQAFTEQDNYGQVTVSFNSGSATKLTVFAGFTGYSGVGAWIRVDNWTMK